eukprot:gb/GFBE01054663.1/.p1 GENE.gb/GFBE01054663.1/~~gb/GFBE01054663.1/.p1  ORF type:complete len:375 (+),score=60.07 gb/GFBE01054663.1/:1-1125(+)
MQGWALVFACSLLGNVLASGAAEHSHSRSSTQMVAMIQTSRGQSLLQKGHVHRVPWTPATALATKAEPSAEAAVPIGNSTDPASSRRRRRTLAALQTRRQTSNCSGLAEPCLPYQSFTEQAVSKLQREPDTTAELAARGELAAASNSSAEVNSTQPIEGLFGPEEPGYQYRYSYSAEDLSAWSTMLPLELHIVGKTLQELLSDYATKATSLADFLRSLRTVLAASCNLPENRILMSSIYGRFVRPLPKSVSMLKTNTGLFPMASSKAGATLSSSVPMDERYGEEVLVRYFLLPSQDNQTDYSHVVDCWRDDLGNSSSLLMTGELGGLLQKASLTVGYQETYGLATLPMEKLSSLALPFAISATFTGILIWMASW